ncbi:MAG: FixH family protein [Halothiobacillaceae bacterium]
MNLLLSLAIGLVLIVLVFLGLNRGLRLPGRQAAVITAILTLGFYLPYALLNWEGSDVLAIHLAVYLMTVFVLGLLTFQREQKLPPSGRSFRWGPGMIIGFFAVIIAMDAMFVTLATSGMGGRVAEILLPKPRHAETVSSHFPGVISHDFQKKEALYNEYLHQVEKQKERGWQVQYGWVGNAIVHQASVFQVQARDKQGEAIVDAKVVASFLRPSDKTKDFNLSLPEVEPGVYRIELMPPLPGLWQVVIVVQRGDDVHEVRASTDVLSAAPQASAP